MSLPWRPLSSAWGIVVTAGLAWPMTWPYGRDSFPLSSYPMFTSPRTMVTSYAIAATSTTGKRPRAVAPEFVADASEVMQAVATIRRAARKGPAARERLCRRVAKRVGDDSSFAEFDALSITRARFDPVAYVHDGASVAQPQVITTCAIER